MSTTPVVASSAPSAPPVAAPVSAPVSTPAPVTAPVAPAAPAVPATPAIQAPDPKDYSGDRFAEFRKAKREFESAQTAEPEAPAVAEAAADAAPESAKVDEPAQPEAITEPVGDPLAEEPSYTPQALTDLATRKPALKALMDADPEVKGMMYSQARQIAALKPLGEIFSDVESAKFAQQTASEYVGLRVKFETATTPEDMNGAFDSFVDQFKLTDDKGAPIMENGKPKLGEDYYAFADTFKAKLFSGAMDEIDERLKANQYSTPEAREADENRKLAYEFLIADKGDDPGTGPDLSALPADVRANIEAREAKLKEREDALNGKEKGKSVEEKAALKAAHYQKFNKEIGGRIQTVFDSTVKGLREIGVYVPSYLLDSPDGRTAPQFVTRVIDQFQKMTGRDAKILRDRVSLEKLPATDGNLQRRVEYEDKLYQAMMPGLIKSELRTVSAKLKADLDERNKPPATANVSQEPKATGAALTPATMTQENTMEQAKKNVAEKFKGKFIDPGEKNAMILAEARRIRNQR